MALETIGLQPISIDVYKKHKQTTIYANEADVNGRGLLVTLVNNGTPIDSTGVTLRMGFLNNVNEQKIYDFTLVDALTGKYSIYYPTELLDQSGGSVKQVEIKAYEGENVITFLPLYLYVNDAVVTNEGLESTNEGSALLKALNEYEGVNNAYILAEQNRDSEYSAAEASRGASYTIVEANRDSLYNVAEAERDSDYDLAEASRDGLYNTAESARGVQYSNAESARNSQYSTAESARDGLYHTAESNRDALLNSVNAQLNDMTQDFNAQLADKATKTEVGLLSGLLTTAKTSIVNAINELFNSKANKAQEAWITPTLLAGWVPYSTAEHTLQYRKTQFNSVQIRGMIKSGLFQAVICTFPVGYRPTKITWFPCGSSSVSAGFLNSNGQFVIFNGNTTWVAINVEISLD